MDRDGDTDVIAGGKHEISWYENDGSQNFTKHRIDYQPSGFFTTVRAADIDNDGNIDIVAGTSKGYTSTTTGDIVWYKLDLTNNTVTEHTVVRARTFGFVPNLRLADINQDGNIDIVAVSKVKLAWFENQNSGTKFTEHAIQTINNRYSLSVAVANFTGDEQLDIAVGLMDGGTNRDIIIYTNTTPPLKFTTNANTPLTISTTNTNEITITDTNNDLLHTTISVSNGTLKLNPTQVPYLPLYNQLTGNNTNTIKFYAQPNQINAVLNGLTYTTTLTPPAGQTATDQINITVNDAWTTTTTTRTITVTP